jgi:hypothetical protein
MTRPAQIVSPAVINAVTSLLRIGFLSSLKLGLSAEAQSRGNLKFESESKEAATFSRDYTDI